MVAPRPGTGGPCTFTPPWLRDAVHVRTCLEPIIAAVTPLIPGFAAQATNSWRHGRTEPRSLARPSHQGVRGWSGAARSCGGRRCRVSHGWRGRGKRQPRGRHTTRPTPAPHPAALTSSTDQHRHTHQHRDHTRVPLHPPAPPPTSPPLCRPVSNRAPPPGDLCLHHRAHLTQWRLAAREPDDDGGDPDRGATFERGVRVRPHLHKRVRPHVHRAAGSIMPCWGLHLQ